MILPTIHLGGTSCVDLLEDNRTAADAIRQAIRKLEAAGPNGRDYYPQGPSAFTQAQQEHQDRLEDLGRVLQDLDTIADHLTQGASPQAAPEGICMYCDRAIHELPKYAQCPKAPGGHPHKAAR